MRSEIDGLRPDGKRKAGGSSSSSAKKEYLVWTSFLVGGQKAYRFERADGTTAEVIPDFDLENVGFRWGVLWPEKKTRTASGFLQVSKPTKRVGGKVRILDEDGSLHYAKSLERAKELAREAMEGGRPT